MKVLHIESSIFADAGVSSQLSRELIDRLKQQHPGLEVIEKRFAEQPVPYFDSQVLQALTTEPDQRSTEQQQIV
ncbi:NAD(P)H-dependent oxidoreductase, partial [Weissella cibaria]|uniref:NAD(P)H-dependent oxidoreductase n=1 Tax=Weissella cibaria TaxID=137591 RepID=UPI001F51196B